MNTNPAYKAYLAETKLIECEKIRKEEKERCAAMQEFYNRQLATVQELFARRLADLLEKVAELSVLKDSIKE